MMEPTTSYVGWLVDPSQRPTLLTRFPPRYAKVVAHHVTLKLDDRNAKPPGQVEAEIVGEVDSGAGVQALIVAIDGSCARPDGGTFHITWSLAPGHQARESNDAIAAGWTRHSSPTPVRLKPFG
jgi:hypothetical protein